MTRYPLPSTADSELKSYLEKVQQTLSSLEARITELEDRISKLQVNSKSKQTLNKN